jgi:hypothetical protein
MMIIPNMMVKHNPNVPVTTNQFWYMFPSEKIIQHQPNPSFVFVAAKKLDDICRWQGAQLGL